MAATKHRCVWVQGWPENAKVLLTWWCLTCKNAHLHMLWHNGFTKSVHHSLRSATKKRHNHHNLMHTCKSSLGPFFPTQKSGKNPHLTSRLNQGLEESTTHNYQIQTVPCPSFALEEEEQSFASILWEWWNLVMTFVFSLKQLCIEWNFYSIFNPGWSGMSLLSPSFPIVFSFSSVTKTRESQNELNGEEEVKDLPNHLSQEKHLDFPCLSLFQKSSSF